MRAPYSFLTNGHIGFLFSRRWKVFVASEVVCVEGKLQSLAWDGAKAPFVAELFYQ